VGQIALAAGILGGLGVLFGAVLAISWRFLRVEEDPRVAEVEEMLPGTNCGACGEPGCRAFALRLVAGGTAPSACTVSAPGDVGAIAEFLGVEVGARDKLVARLHCAGGRAQARQIAEYERCGTCAAAAVVAGGGKGCWWGCLGLGDCDRACTFDAIEMNENGLPVVDVERCTACNDCVEVCPRDLFELLPLGRPLLVQCRIPLVGDEARALCSVACDGCERCAQDAAAGLITMIGSLPVVDYARPDAARDATYRCPTRAIRWVPGRQFEDVPERSR